MQLTVLAQNSKTIQSITSARPQGRWRGVLLLVLGAHDCPGSRQLVEEEVRRCEAEEKGLVFVLKKIDSVPCENAQAFAEGLPTHEPNDALLREPGPTSPLALHRPSLSHFRGVQDWRGAALQLGSRASSTSPVASLTEYWDKSGLLCIIVKQDDDDDPIADVSSHRDPPLTHAEELTKPTHYISGGLSLDHHLLYAGMLDGWRWREFGVTGPKAEAALTSMESCNHRS
ncbi:hypothetical protein EDB83DRAFT_2321957 [Lactarius deliciosus]|nr:hypothetical protein EDB83DRAFT_2321957 [Lactarius deliciosus]